MPLPEDEAEWKSLMVIFATAKGNVRKNSLEDFANINNSGKIAMKLDTDDKIIGVKICKEDQDILLSTKLGKCIRFSCSDLRIFSGRSSIGVRGIKLSKGDTVISLAILNGIDFDVTERDEYLRISTLMRKNEKIENNNLNDEKFKNLQENEEFILSVTDKGFGKRSSAFEYRKTKRGGLGIANMQLSDRNGSQVVASFPINNSDQLVLVTDKGKLIRCPVNDVRIGGRQTQGVTLFNVSDEEKVVSVAKLEEND